MLKLMPAGMPGRLSQGQYEIPWDGVPLRTSPYLAFDTETDIVDLSREIPRLALMTVSNGTRHVVIRPEQVLRFVLCHREALWVGFNVAYDWHVVYKQLQAATGAGCGAGLESWCMLLDQGRLHDAMLLDFLVRLADPCATVHSVRDLGRAAEDWLNCPVDKSDPFRMRFGELIGADWEKADPGFFDYAIKDTAVTWAMYSRMHARGRELYARACPPLSRHEPWGLLTEQIQVKASVVLADIGRNGMAIDRDGIAGAVEGLRLGIAENVRGLREAGYADIFTYYKEKKRAGQIRVNARTGTPMFNMLAIRKHLADVAAENEIEPSALPKAKKTGDLSTALDGWREMAPEHPLVANWTEMADDSKILQFLVKLEGDSVHPRYHVLKRTGRTSATDPNIQQMPRAPWFRGLFTARPGCKLAIIDYSFIELRTLAAVCLDRFGFSVLADTIKAGRDPHVWTAALVRGMGYEEFLALKKTDPDAFKAGRQAAKAVNFGVPGGLGARKLAAYAKANYGVQMTLEEASDLRKRLTTVVYPELARYLADSTAERLARSLGCPKDRLLKAIGISDDEESAGLWSSVQKVIGGARARADGSSYSPKWRQRVFEALADCAEDMEIQGRLLSWQGGASLSRRLLGGTAVTVTGRVRAGLGYCEERNTPFQGLAADGAKESLYRIWKAGYRIVAFIHDEIVVEVEEARAEAALEDVSRLMREGMQATFACDVPVEVEGHIAERWGK